MRPGQIVNPYQRVISILGRTLRPFTEEGQVYAYGFGDKVTQDKESGVLLTDITHFSVD